MANIFIPPKTVGKIHTLGLSEAQVMDVFNTGQEFDFNGKNAIKKKFSNYEIGVVYERRANGEYVIFGVWKRDRR